MFIINCWFICMHSPSLDESFFAVQLKLLKLVQDEKNDWKLIYALALALSEAFGEIEFAHRSWSHYQICEPRWKTTSARRNKSCSRLSSLSLINLVLRWQSKHATCVWESEIDTFCSLKKFNKNSWIHQQAPVFRKKSSWWSQIRKCR